MEKNIWMDKCTEFQWFSTLTRQNILCTKTPCKHLNILLQYCFSTEASLHNKKAFHWLLVKLLTWLQSAHSSQFCAAVPQWIEWTINSIPLCALLQREHYRSACGNRGHLFLTYLLPIKHTAKKQKKPPQKNPHTHTKKEWSSGCKINSLMW